MTAKHIVIRCDASPAIGAGHVMRCLAFAETLAWAGWSATFATRRESLAVTPVLSVSGHGIRIVDDEDDLLAADDVQALLVDHYDLDATFEQALLAPNRTVIAFDDLADRPHAADIVLDPTPGRVPADYAGHVTAKTNLLLGADHAIIRREWRALRAKTSRRLAQGNPVQRILVSMGSTDPNDTTSRVLKAIELSKLPIDVDVVLGEGAPHLEHVASLTGGRVKLHVNPGEFPSLVAGADLVIGAPGSSAFERAVLGMPVILIPYADNQRFVGAAFAAAGAAEVLPSSMLDKPEELGSRIAVLARDSMRLAAMSRAAAAMTDGRGNFRLLMALAGGVRSVTGLHLSLRLANDKDSDWLLALQSKPGIRRFAMRPEIPTPHEHDSWFAATLANPDRLLMIVETSGVAVGMLRLDRVAAAIPTFELSIAIEPSWHRKGVGLAALQLARKVAPGADILATVLSGNEASLALFQAAGYDREGPERLRSRAA